MRSGVVYHGPWLSHTRPREALHQIHVFCGLARLFMWLIVFAKEALSLCNGDW